jgi:hypothetical protein
MKDNEILNNKSKPLIGGSKILIHEKDFRIEKSRMVVEHFVWDCPNCGKTNRTLEFNVKNNKLWCDGCYKETTYAWR